MTESSCQAEKFKCYPPLVFKYKALEWDFTPPGNAFFVFGVTIKHDPRSNIRCCKFIQWAQVSMEVEGEINTGDPVGMPLDDKWHIDSYPYRDDDVKRQGYPRSGFNDTFNAPLSKPDMYGEDTPGIHGNNPNLANNGSGLDLEGITIKYRARFKGSFYDICKGYAWVANSNVLFMSMSGTYPDMKLDPADVPRKTD